MGTVLDDLIPAIAIDLELNVPILNKQNPYWQ
jgi:hypothetical protein